MDRILTVNLSGETEHSKLTEWGSLKFRTYILIKFLDGWSPKYDEQENCWGMQDN